MLDELRYRLRALFRRDTLDRELRDELAFHIECEVQKLIADGLPRDEAERRARVAIGGINNTLEVHRDRRGTRWLDDTLSDLRYALRIFTRNPGLAAAAVVTLALAIGANAAMYAAVNAVLLRPLPFAHPDRLVMVGENNPEFQWHMEAAAPANMLDWRTRVNAFEDVMAYASFDQPVTFMHDGSPMLISTRAITGNFFSVLGVVPQVGRFFTFDETWANATNGIVLSDRFWRDNLRTDRGIIGQSIIVNGRARTVVGVAPPGFDFPETGTAVWVPIGWAQNGITKDSFRRAHFMRTVARLKNGVTVEQASTQLRAVAAQLKREYPATNRVMDAELAPLHRFLVGDTRLPLLVLLAAVGLLLLIACANVGNLLLVRAASREREVAVRVALGAGRSRLVRQAFIESLVLALAGGAVGLALGWWGTGVLSALVPEGMLRVERFSVDWRVALYVLAATTACGVLFGIAPAVWASRRDPSDALKAGGRSASGGARAHRWGQRLAVAEVAVALLLSIGAGLLIRSYSSLLRVDPGFDGRNVVTVAIALPGTRYDSVSKILNFYYDLLRQVRALPGVSDAAVTAKVPMSDQGWTSDFSVQGASAGHYSSSLVHREISPDYFRTMRVPTIRGRTFTADDRGRPGVVVINEALARTTFAGQDPIGQRITFERVPDSTSNWRTIVGVVGSEHQASAAEPAKIEVFEPLAAAPRQSMILVARTAGDPSAMAPMIRRVVASLDPQLALSRVETMETVEAASMARDRFLMLLLTLFGVVGLVLAVVGVYGVVAQLARGRMRELGIRVALGASASSVRWLIIGHGLRLTLAGLLIGAVVAALSTRALARLLFGIAPTDPLTFVVVGASLVVAALCASWLPGHRAASVDPVATLRQE